MDGFEQLIGLVVIPIACHCAGRIDFIRHPTKIVVNKARALLAAIRPDRAQIDFILGIALFLHAQIQAVWILWRDWVLRDGSTHAIAG